MKLEQYLGGITLFIVARTKEEINLFKNIVAEVHREIEVPTSIYKENAEIYILYSDNKTPIGGFECSLFKQSEELHFSYVKLPKMNKLLNKRIFQIGKIVIINEYRGKNFFKDILLGIYDHYKRHNPDYYLGNIDTRLLKKLKVMGFKPIILAEEVTFGKRKIIPVLIDANTASSHFRRFEWASKKLGFKLFS
ncbi:hypothetical protein [Rossellomorea aquimaris]|uniref:hypothetical protein n=1 Tax=Rossellomorea aquimaris TaxID=189382 RepID=UPI0007D0B168|nr:hypothetical protein [Rossellomorea aquimaris]